MNIAKVFLVCPIGSVGSKQRQYSNLLLRKVIEPVMDKLNCSVVRADQIPNPGRINDQIDCELRSADIVVADLRDLNPNVMFELGFRQGLGRPSVLMAPEGQSLPFDLQDYRTIFYPQDLNDVEDVKYNLKLQVETGLRRSLEGDEDNWLHKDKIIVKIEENIECKSIWIITPDLSHTTNFLFLKDVVIRNLQRGITYTYIFPRTEQTLTFLHKFRQVFSSFPNQIVERPMPEDVFRTMAVSHYLVFEPDGCSEKPPQVFLELPIKSREYWIEVDRDAAQGFYSRFYKIAKGL